MAINHPKEHDSNQDWIDAAWESLVRSYGRRQEESYAPLFTPVLKFTILVLGAIAISLLILTYGDITIN